MARTTFSRSPAEFAVITGADDRVAKHRNNVLNQAAFNLGGRAFDWASAPQLTSARWIEAPPPEQPGEL